MPMYKGINNIARKVEKNYTGVNNISRKVTSRYVSVDGVTRRYFSSDMTWGKYSCDLHGGYYELNETGWSNSDGQWIMTNVSNPYEQVVYTGYDFSASSGLYGTGETVVYPPAYAINKLDEMNDLYVGKYVVDSTIAYRYDSIDGIEFYGGDYAVRYSYTVLATADYIDISYHKGSASYGTVEAPQGELPEEGTLVEGSVDEGYCVLQIGTNYYYYILEV